MIVSQSCNIIKVKANMEYLEDAQIRIRLVGTRLTSINILRKIIKA